MAFTPAEYHAWWQSLDARVSSATVIIEDTEGRALIVKAHYKQHWTFPGGIIDAGEMPLRAAIRETYEEVGIVLPEDSVSFAWVASRAGDFASTYQFVFHASLPAGTAELALQPEEIAEAAWITKADVQRSDRHYGKVVKNWAAGVRGYVEQSYDL